MGRRQQLLRSELPQSSRADVREEGRRHLEGCALPPPREHRGDCCPRELAGDGGSRRGRPALGVAAEPP
eukprot:3192585-Pyramimonas_sp.AAC.1